MSKFYEVTAGKLTVAECDRIALENAGRVASVGYSFAIPRGGDINEEYAAKVINTRGMGNHGTIVLVGKTKRARRLLYKGRVRWLVKNGISECVAKAAAVMHRGMELDVAKLADKIYPIVAAGSEYLGNSHSDFDEWCGFSSGLSYPRKMAALAIAEKAAGKGAA